jgi:hypothetical protein
LSVLNVQGVFGIDEGTLTADFLHFGNDLQGECGFARGLWAVYFNHTAAGQAADAQGDIEAQRTGGDDLDVFDDFAFTQAHDGAFAELFFNLGQGSLQGFGFVAVLIAHENLLENQRFKKGAFRKLIKDWMLEQYCKAIVSIRK